MSSPKDSIGAPRSCRRTRASVSTTSTADDISTPPTKTEIRYWKNLLYQERRGATQHYFMYGTPMNARHEKWLREKERKERKERHEKAVKIKEQTSTTTARESKLKAQTPEPTVVESTDSDSETVESSTAQSEDSQATTVVPIAKPPERKYHYVSLYSLDIGKWYPKVAVLSISTKHNFISKHTTDTLKLRVLPGPVLAHVQISDFEATSKETVEITWGSEGRGKSHVTTFHVVPNLPFAIIFGRDLLYSGKVDFFLPKLGPVPDFVMTQDEMEETEKQRLQSQPTSVLFKMMGSLPAQRM